MQNDSTIILNTLIDAAHHAGAAIMDIYTTEVTVDYKSDKSPVTKADQDAEAIIIEAIDALNLGYPIVAEESVSAGNIPHVTDAPFFLIDPLDGTKEFINKGKDFTVNIALISNYRPILGVIYVPASDILYYGSPDSGAHKITDYHLITAQKIRLSTRKAIKNSLVITASKSHLNPATAHWIKSYPDATCINAGSSLKFCTLAEGNADLYPRLAPTMEWDTAAGHAILLAAGGDVLDGHGNPLRYGKQGFLNGNFFARADTAFNIHVMAD